MEIFDTRTISLEDELDAAAYLDGLGYVKGYDYQFLFFEDSIAVELFNEQVHSDFTVMYPGL